MRMKKTAETHNIISLSHIILGMNFKKAAIKNIKSAALSKNAPLSVHTLFFLARYPSRMSVIPQIIYNIIKALDSIVQKKIIKENTILDTVILLTIFLIYMLSSLLFY